MTEKHTPGPWRVVGSEVWGCRFRLADGRGTYDEKDRRRRNANAQLIAAAPELLEAAKLALEVLEGMSENADIISAKLALGPTIEKAEGHD